MSFIIFGLLCMIIDIEITRSGTGLREDRERNEEGRSGHNVCDRFCARASVGKLASFIRTRVTLE
jgi:hypothetical protein